MTRMKKYMFGLMGAGMLVLPLTMASTAQADDFRISLNLGNPAPVYHNAPAVRYSHPAPVVVKQVYRPAPQRVVYKEVYRPQRVVVKQVYRGGRGHNQHYAQGHGRWDNNNHGRYVAWR